MTDSKLIAFCGIDGAGKSSIFNEVKASNRFPNSVFLKKNIKTNINLVKKYYKSDRKWINSSFAKSAAVAASLDFAMHYKYNILPTLGGFNYVFCDRYSLCYLSYLKATLSDFPADAFFKNFAKPHILFFVDVPVHIATMRHHKRGGPGEDEQPDVMEKFRNAYLDMLATYSDARKIVLLDNTVPFPVVMDQVYKYIEEI